MSQQILHTATQPSSAPPRHRLALAVLCLAQFGVVLAFQGTAISLPEIERALDLSTSTGQWLMSANALAFGGLLLPAGRAADLFGHRRLFVLGTALFGAASLAAGLAPSVQALIVARALQGAGAALFSPAAIALLADGFPAGPERRRALAAWGMAGPFGGVGAILLGGALASAIGWRAVFLLGAPLTVPVLLLALRVLPPVQRRERGRLDPLGAIAGAVGIGLLVYTLGSVTDATVPLLQLIGCLGIGLALIALLVVKERRSDQPLVPRSLRRPRDPWPAIFVAFFHGASINTPIVFYSLFMQHYRSATPWEIGLGFLPCNFALIAASAVSARLAHYIGYRGLMAVGMAAIIGGLMILTTLTADGRYVTTILPGWLLFGAGANAAQVGIVGAATERAAPDDRGVVGGLINTSAQLGTAVGLALLVLLSRYPVDEIDGYRIAFAGGGGLALLGLLIALVTLRRHAVLALREAGGAATPARELPQSRQLRDHRTT